MYELIKLISRRDLQQQQLPVCMASFVIAELLYRFRSFTLECAAFLATWFVLDWAVSRARRDAR